VKKLQQLTSKLYQMEVDRCVPLWCNYITIYRG